MHIFKGENFSGDCYLVNPIFVCSMFRWHSIIPRSYTLVEVPICMLIFLFLLHITLSVHLIANLFSQNEKMQTLEVGSSINSTESIS
jgi:hypothetical protein